MTTAMTTATTTTATAAFALQEDQGALPPPPGPAPVDYETLAALSPAKVKFGEAEFGEDDEDDDEDYVPGNDDEEEEEDEEEDDDGVEGVFGDMLGGEGARVAGVSSAALAKVPGG